MDCWNRSPRKPYNGTHAHGDREMMIIGVGQKGSLAVSFRCLSVDIDLTKFRVEIEFQLL